ncbi:hypothetical protein HAX54_049856 [Datura stramonium]|uniref:Uncharacterized protein n=1 Tax=Datura stramonium TaxID=4076 RepID=A0ABS8SVJ4_DATST|nr:hypothetical protein [Datura stramonium]
MERSYIRTVWVIMRTNDPSYFPIGFTGKMNSIGKKKQQEASTRKEIAKRRQLFDESESDSSSGLEVYYNIETSNETPVVTTRERNYDAEESEDKDTEAEEFGDKESAAEKSGEQEEPKIRVNALNEVPKLKRLFKNYNIHWMAKTPGKYSMEMVRVFYANYYCTLEKKVHSKNAIKKEPMLDSVRVRAIPVYISEQTITMFSKGGDYTVPT